MIYGFFGISRHILQSQCVPCCCLMLCYKVKLLDWVQSKSYPVGCEFPTGRLQSRHQEHQMVLMWVFFFLFFFSIKPQRKWLNWLKGQADVAAHTITCGNDLTFEFFCFRVAESLKDRFILQEEVVSAALCSWKGGGARPHSTLPGVRYTLEGHAGIIREPGLPEKQE